MKVARGGGVGLIPVKWREDSPLDYQTVQYALFTQIQYSNIQKQTDKQNTTYICLIQAKQREDHNLYKVHFENINIHKYNIHKYNMYILCIHKYKQTDTKV